ncbi:Retrovirus-related Pol polyprotein from transposon RE1 [Vitis vinifera]|uniref:Retrovirus-related Pol polyprotein from transposon RE1 n=1 Tax=Vitis vinifera TaxID=29760 RepID=A0A438EMA1_VITVI|nr:Retrovirus-related Pol polyprotein from transposon RE1 [Vitis vinifera]
MTAMLTTLEVGIYQAPTTNGGGEFKVFQTFLQSCGILHCISCPYNHEQNGLVECKHHHIVEVGFTLLAQSHLPLNLWDHVFITVSLVPPPSNHQVVGCKWVFKVKHNSDGSANRYKARLVAKGFHQVPSFDFHDTFSLVIKPTTIRVVLSLIISRDWPMRQLDFNNVFLNDIPKNDIYMAQPPRFIDATHPNWVCKLHRALYGLKQAPRTWFERFYLLLYQLGFHSFRADSFLFFKFEDGHSFYILIYVNDVLITSSSPTQGVLLLQQKYINEVLHKAHIDQAKPVPTPMVKGVSLSTYVGAPFDDHHIYCHIVGGLQYATITSPEIAFVVSRVSQFMKHSLEPY